MYRFAKLNPLLFLILFLFSFSIVAAPKIKEIRIWPSPEYTRITIESTAAIKNSYMKLKNPDRIVVDLNDVIINDALKKSSKKVLKS